MAAALVLVLAVAAGACQKQTSQPELIFSGSPALGRKAIKAHGCGSCHQIPGVDGADAFVGPPLTNFGRRSYIAGELANTPENLARWVQDPKAIEPRTDMPNLGVTPDEARNIAAYLENLR